MISASDLRTPTRRQVLAGTLLLALSACADGNTAGGGLSPAEQALRRQTVEDEQRLLAAYAATAARHPGLAGTLAVPWRQHREHAARLADVGGASAGTSGANGTLSATPSATSSATPVPADAQAAVRALAALERSVAAARRQACAAAGRGLAPLLGTLAAAEQVHADVLLAGGRAAGADAGSGGGQGVSDQDELGRLLVFEHAAVYGYGLSGAVLATATPPARAGLALALSGLQTHRDRRDALIAEIVSAGGTPPPGDAAYRYPRPDSTKAALTLIADIEDSVAATCHDVLGRLDSGSLRTQVAGFLGTAATTAARARLLNGADAAQATTSFPGGG